MTTKQKEDFKNGFSIVHQWMTIIGFPVLLYLVGDMYSCSLQGESTITTAKQ